MSKVIIIKTKACDISSLPISVPSSSNNGIIKSTADSTNKKALYLSTKDQLKYIKLYQPCVKSPDTSISLQASPPIESKSEEQSVEKTCKKLNNENADKILKILATCIPSKSITNNDQVSEVSHAVKETKVSCDKTENYSNIEKCKLEVTKDATTENCENDRLSARSVEENVLDFIDLSDDSSKDESFKPNARKKPTSKSNQIKSRPIRKNHSLNFHIRPGRGKKLSSFERIEGLIDSTSRSALRFLHYVLLGSYGHTLNDLELSRTKQNILLFSGYAFQRDSQLYEKKYISLLRAPYAVLLEIYDLIIGKISRERIQIIDELIEFFLCPKISCDFCYEDCENFNCKTSEIISREEEENILKGPNAVVVLDKLNVDSLQISSLSEVLCNGDSLKKYSVNADSFEESSIEDIDEDLHDENQCKDESSSEDKCEDKEDTPKEDQEEHFEKDTCEDLPKENTKSKPTVKSSKNSGTKLKDLPHIAHEIQEARRKVINLLHTFLFGRPGSGEQNRFNILEFNGFGSHTQSFVSRRHGYLLRLANKDLLRLCDMFSVARSGPRHKKVKELMSFFRAPSSYRKPQLGRPRKGVISNEENSKGPVKRSRKTSDLKRACNLGEFQNVRHSIESSPPHDLTELNDLLFIKPTDSSDIHQKLLSFKGFDFDEDSMEFHYRKTLLQYMPIDNIIKIAYLLDLSTDEDSVSRLDMSERILKFLLEMKRPVVSKNETPSKRLKLNKGSSKSRLQADSGHVSYELENSDSVSNGYVSLNCTDSNNSHKNCLPKCHACNTTILVKRISENSYSWTDLNDNQPLTISESKSDEAISLQDYVRHPSANELEAKIRDIVLDNQWTITVGDVVNKVLYNYPEFNLTYRVEFIKAKTLEAVQDLQCMK